MCALAQGSHLWEQPLSVGEAVRLAEAHRAEDAPDIRDAAVAETVAAIHPSLQELKLTVPAGSCVLMSYDMYHRGTRRLADDADWRAMLKFQFYGTELPVSVTPWAPGESGDAGFFRHARRLDDLPAELCSPELLPAGLQRAEDAAVALVARRGGTDEGRMEAAYALAALSRGGDRAAVDALCSVLCDGTHDGCIAVRVSRRSSPNAA